MHDNPTAASLTTSLLLNHAPQQPRAERKWLQDLGGHKAAWVWVVSQKIEEIKQVIEFRESTDTAFELKMQLSCFPVLRGSAEAQVIWGGIVKRRLIAYIIRNISAKNVKIRSHLSKS